MGAKTSLPIGRKKEILSDLEVLLGFREFIILKILTGFGRSRIIL